MNAPRELLIIGTGGLAKECAQLARQMDPHQARWDRFYYVAESSEMLNATLPYGVVRFTDTEALRRRDECDVVIAIGHPQLRRRLARLFASNDAFSFPNLIHPSVEIDTICVSIGRGNIFAKGVVLTCDIEIGDFNLINWNVTVGHDASIGSYNVVNPSANLSGHTSLGDACLLGTGCQVLEKLTVASDITIGAGAVVTRSILMEGTTHVGIPAKQIRR